MTRRNVLTLSTAVFLSLSLSALAQPKSIKDQLVGTWILVSNVNTDKDGKKIDTWGANPKGTIMIDNSGHFAQILLRSDLPKTATRESGTPEQDKAIVKGSSVFYGTYSVDEAGKTINIHYDASSFASFVGTDAKRTITALTADELKINNPTTSGGTTSETTWRRAK